jgi:hypothetical protein
LDLQNLKNEFLETKDEPGYEATQLHDEPELETLEKKLSKIFPSFSTHPPVQRVDGKALSENEILFEEYLSLEFDEKNQNTFRQLVIQRSKTVCKKKGRGIHQLRNKSL